MNCHLCQEALVNSLAAGGGLLAAEVSSHLNFCVCCRSFYVAQQALFRSINTGLQSLVNQPMPPSLLAAARGRIDETTMPINNWGMGWWASGFAAVAVALLVFAYVLRRPVAPRSVQRSSPLDLARLAPVEPEMQVKTETATETVSRAKNRKSGSPHMSSGALSTKVIVLAEEREAFARFVAQVPSEQGVVLALTRPVVVPADESVDIALLQIDSLKVKALDPAIRE